MFRIFKTSDCLLCTVSCSIYFEPLVDPKTSRLAELRASGYLYRLTQQYPGGPPDTLAVSDPPPKHAVLGGSVALNSIYFSPVGAGSRE